MPVTQYQLREIAVRCEACVSGNHSECRGWLIDRATEDNCDCPCMVYEEFWAWWHGPAALTLTLHDKPEHRNGYEDFLAETVWFAARGLILPDPQVKAG